MHFPICVSLFVNKRYEKKHEVVISRLDLTLLTLYPLSVCVLHLDLCTIMLCTRVVYHLFDKGYVADGTIAKGSVLNGSDTQNVASGSVAKANVANGYAGNRRVAILCIAIGVVQIGLLQRAV